MIYFDNAATTLQKPECVVRAVTEALCSLCNSGRGVHSFEMAQGSGCTIHIQTGKVPYHPEALELASMGLVPAGAYRNRQYAQAGAAVRGSTSLALEDILYDPQTSGGLLFALPEAEAQSCLAQLRQAIPGAAIIGYVTEKEDAYIILE